MSQPSKTKVVNMHHNELYDVFIGRRANNKFHYGNPFSHTVSLLDVQHVETREEAVTCFRAWIHGEDFKDVDPERRLWILSKLPELKGKTLACYCAPRSCHGDVLAEMADENNQTQL